MYRKRKMEKLTSHKMFLNIKPNIHGMQNNEIKNLIFVSIMKKETFPGL
jgi:hypothetical protein